MGTCEDSCPPITLVSEFNLPVHPNRDCDGDRDGSSPQVLVQKLESFHLVEKRVEIGDGSEEEDGVIEGAGVQDEHCYSPHPLRPGVEDCAFYIKTGTCKFGWNCRFNHPLNRFNQLADADSQETDGQGTHIKGKIECKYYLSSGGCKYGDKCRYSHSKAKTDDEPIELNFLGLPIRRGERECPYYMRNGSCGYGANCRFDHPDPIATTEEPKNVIANSGVLQGGNSRAARNLAEFAPPMSSMHQSVSHFSSSEKASSFVPWVNSLPQGMPPIPGYNQYQVSVSLTDNTVSSRPTRSVGSPVKNADSLGYNQQLLHNAEFPERPGQPECDFFMKTGSCKYRSACKYHHPRNRSHSMPGGVTHNLTKGANHLTHDTQMAQMDEYPERPGQPECTYFMKTGECKYKSACKYHHPKSRLSKVAVSTYGMNGMNSLPSGMVSTPSHNLYPSHLNQPAKPFRNHQLPVPPEAGVEEYPERPGAQECHYFMKTGDCKYRSACRYHHPKGSRSQASARPECAFNEKGLPLRPDAEICRNYEQLGICKHGPRCLFDHPANYDALATPESPAPQSPPGNNVVDWGDGW